MSRIQNECLVVMANNMIRELSQNIRESSSFTIMADEYTGYTANKEEFNTCVRWVVDLLEP